jgi:hypothetical protein
MVSAGRHIDTDARMIWQSLRREARAMTAAQVHLYWNPTFSVHQVVEALQRLVAGRYLEAVVPQHSPHVYFVSDSCVPLPGFTVAATRPPVGVPRQ